MSDEVRTRVAGRGRVLYLAGWEAWLRPRGYLEPDGPLPDAARAVFFRSARRENARRRDGPDGRVLYDKRLCGIPRASLLRTLCATGRPGTPLLREWLLLREGRRAGLRVPEPWAVGEVAGRRGFLLVTALPGRPLDVLAGGAPPGPRAGRERIAGSVARAVAELHGAGIRFPGLWAKHVLVDDAGGVGFIDLASASRVGRVRGGARARDLAALAASLPRTHVPATLRLRFLHAYVAAADDPGLSVRALWRRSGRLVSRLQRLRRLRRNRATARGRFVALRDERPGLSVAPEAADLLASAGLLPDPSAAAGGDGFGSVGDLLVLRGTAEAVRRRFALLQTLHAFGVDVPVPCLRWLDPESGTGVAAFRALPGAWGPARVAGPQDPAALAELLERVLEAGALPEPSFADHVLVGPRGRLGLDHRVACRTVRRLRRGHVRRARRRALPALSRLAAGSP